MATERTMSDLLVECANLKERISRAEEVIKAQSSLLNLLGEKPTFTMVDMNAAMGTGAKLKAYEKFYNVEVHRG